MTIPSRQNETVIKNSSRNVQLQTLALLTGCLSKISSLVRPTSAAEVTCSAPMPYSFRKACTNRTEISVITHEGGAHRRFLDLGQQLHLSESHLQTKGLTCVATNEGQRSRLTLVKHSSPKFPCTTSMSCCANGLRRGHSNAARKQTFKRLAHLMFCDMLGYLAELSFHNRRVP